jgi:hypothetical protein
MLSNKEFPLIKVIGAGSYIPTILNLVQSTHGAVGVESFDRDHP